MSVMSDVFVTITEGLEKGMSTIEIAYALTCEYPAIDIPTAKQLIADVIQMEQEYLEELK